MSVKVVVRSVRDPLAFDTHLYDAGVDCSVDPDTGKELTSMTKQAFRDECDINNIMRKYERTGVLDHVASSVPQYGEYMGSMSYQESLNAILYAQEQFMDLPAELRARFGNDPAQLLAFMEDSANLDEAVKLGLVQAPTASIVPKPSSENPGSDSQDNSPPQAAPVSPKGDRKPATAGAAPLAT